MKGNYIITAGKYFVASCVSLQYQATIRQFIHHASIITRRLAISHPQEFMSIITDGMAQVHCELPWQANKTTFPKKLTQHLQGVLEHGQTISIFRTFENVGTGSNLGIHCLLSVLENRYLLTLYERHVDGNSNTLSLIP